MEAIPVQWRLLLVKIVHYNEGNFIVDAQILIYVTDSFVCDYSCTWTLFLCGKFWKRWEYQTNWPASWEICMQVRKQQLELDTEQQTGSK